MGFFTWLFGKPKAIKEETLVQAIMDLSNRPVVVVPKRDFSPQNRKKFTRVTIDTDPSLLDTVELITTDYEYDSMVYRTDDNGVDTTSEDISECSKMDNCSISNSVRYDSDWSSNNTTNDWSNPSSDSYGSSSSSYDSSDSTSTSYSGSDSTSSW